MSYFKFKDENGYNVCIKNDIISVIKEFTTTIRLFDESGKVISSIDKGIYTKDECDKILNVLINYFLIDCDKERIYDIDNILNGRIEEELKHVFISLI